MPRPRRGCICPDATVAVAVRAASGCRFAAMWTLDDIASRPLIVGSPPQSSVFLCWIARARARRAAMSKSPDTRVTHASAHSGHKLRRNVGASQHRMLSAKSRRPANGGEWDPIIGSSTRFLECRGACCAAPTPAQMSGFLDVASRGSRRSGAAIHRRDVGQHAMCVDVLNGDIEGVPRAASSLRARGRASATMGYFELRDERSVQFR